MRVLEGLIAELRERCGALPDRRTGRNGRYAMADIGLAAFSVFVSLNLLAFAMHNACDEHHRSITAYLVFAG